MLSFLGPEGKQQLKVAGEFSAVGIELALSVVVGLFGGRYLDGLWDTTPWLKWIGLCVGLASGFRSIYRLSRRTQRSFDSDAGSSQDDDGVEAKKESRP